MTGHNLKRSNTLFSSSPNTTDSPSPQVWLEWGRIESVITGCSIRGFIFQRPAAAGSPLLSVQTGRGTVITYGLHLFHSCSCSCCVLSTLFLPRTNTQPHCPRSSSLSVNSRSLSSPSRRNHSLPAELLSAQQPLDTNMFQSLQRTLRWLALISSRLYLTPTKSSQKMSNRGGNLYKHKSQFDSAYASPSVHQ